MHIAAVVTLTRITLNYQFVVRCNNSIASHCSHDAGCAASLTWGPSASRDVQLCLPRRARTWSAPCYHSSLTHTSTHTHTHRHSRACLRCESCDNSVPCKTSHHVSLLTVIARLLCLHTCTHHHKYVIVVTKVRTTGTRRLTGCDEELRHILTQATELRSIFRNILTFLTDWSPTEKHLCPFLGYL